VVEWAVEVLNDLGTSSERIALHCPLIWSAAQRAVSMIHSAQPLLASRAASLRRSDRPEPAAALAVFTCQPYATENARNGEFGEQLTDHQARLSAAATSPTSIDGYHICHIRPYAVALEAARTSEVKTTSERETTLNRAIVLARDEKGVAAVVCRLPRTQD
jgi:hypothetical protein